jgi:Family of unknown function (DUF6445)
MAASLAEPRFALNPAAGLDRHLVGVEREPVIVIDDALLAPDRLVDYAASQTGFTSAEAGGYPGVLAPAPLDYVETLVRQLDPLLRTTYGLRDVVLVDAQCSFSIVTTPPGALATAQRLPHIDTSYPLQFAVLHYLCSGPFGGTGFFRHVESGFETVGSDRAQAYRAAVDREIEAAVPPPGYLAGDGAGHVLTAAIEALWNRVVAYRSCLLHCGLIPQDMPLTADPRQGRLTANIFVNYAHN